jgi:hypothetical protein
MPAHITALYPFLPADRLTGEVVVALRELSAAVPLIDVRFRRTARFPGVLYLEPEPAGWMRELTASIAQRWPDAPPYGGSVDDVIPHLTVAYNANDGVLTRSNPTCVVVCRSVRDSCRHACMSSTASSGGRAQASRSGAVAAASRPPRHAIGGPDANFEVRSAATHLC